MSSDAELAFPAVGQAVVVESSRAVFVAGTVTRASLDRVSVRLDTTGEMVELAASELYQRSVTGQLAGEREARLYFASDEPRFGVCHMPDGHWRGCRVEKLGARALVVDDDAHAADLALGELLVPTALTELNVRQRFERNAKRRRFREGAAQAGQPRVPSRWRPTPGEQVVARREGAWVGAEVKRVNRATVRVSWATDGRSSDVASSEVAPEPPIDFAPTVGIYVLVRPASGVRTWSVMRVESAGASTLLVSDELGDAREVALRDVVPLERGAGE